MATSIRDCSLFFESILRSSTWKYDSTIISLPWVSFKVKERLRIGLVEDDGMFTPSPPIRRGMKIAVDRIRQRSDIELVSLKLPDVSEHYRDLIAYWSLSGADVSQQTLLYVPSH